MCIQSLTLLIVQQSGTWCVNCSSIFQWFEGPQVNPDQPGNGHWNKCVIVIVRLLAILARTDPGGFPPPPTSSLTYHLDVFVFSLLPFQIIFTKYSCPGVMPRTHWRSRLRQPYFCYSDSWAFITCKSWICPTVLASLYICKTLYFIINTIFSLHFNFVIFLHRKFVACVYSIIIEK